ncbi:DNA alkylation repair protein [bacterium]|nr:DNA alkylation repair protein [bacterium]MBU1637112.1 DNA alkylation repair protein [bacterium]
MSASSLTRWAASVEQRLRKLSSSNMPPGGAAYLGTDIEFLNVRAPDMRKLARELCEDLPAEWRNCAQALWEIKIFDVRNLAVELAVRHKKDFQKSDWNRFKPWLDESVGWAMIDRLTTDLYADLLDCFPDYAGKCLTWSKSKNLWLRRASLAVFCRPARKGQFIEQSFANLKRLASDPDPMVYKAVSWLLRNLTKTNRRQVEAFLKDHESVLAKLVLREVRTKLETGKKNPKR